MVMPMLLPIIPLLKVIALGSVKLVFLAVGAGFFPIYTLRVILGGATGMLMPALKWLLERERLDEADFHRITKDLEQLSELEFTRGEARQVLWVVIGKTVNNMLSAVVGLPSAIGRFFSMLKNRNS